MPRARPQYASLRYASRICLLVEARLDQQREDAFAHLAHQRPLGREVQVLDQLLGERAAALLHLRRS